MQVLQILSGPPFILAFTFFLFLAFKSAKTWKRVKEEIFIHLTFLFLAISILTIMTYFGMFFISLPGQFDKSLLFYLGLLYDLFYLELSFLYLTLFSNSIKFFEKYIPILITIAFLLNFVAGYSQIEPYIEIAIVFHAIVILMGLYIVYRAFNHFKISIIYNKNQGEIELLNYLSKMTIFFMLILISDGVGFLILHYWVKLGFLIDELIILYVEIILIIIVVLLYLVARTVMKKAKDIDLIQFLNNLS